VRPGEKKLRLNLLLLVLLVVPAGCDHAEANRLALHVVAKVNGAEISALQATTPQALEKIIDRELLVQKALAAGIDRDPQMQQQIENARRQLLAQAYLDRMALGAKSSAEEIHAFYSDNPALFAERRIYRLRELVVTGAPELIDVMRPELGRTKDLEDIAAWLRSRDAKFSLAVLAQPSEQLPLSYLPQLSRMKEGDMALFPMPVGAAVVQLVAAQDAPLNEQQAAPLIESFLAGRKRLELAAAEVRRLREVAKIEYVGELKGKSAR
jgi:EpsD family peptidyl-prolyl cis-trans isomerase